ncbi:MAG: pentapeptide repeat-containing protein [Bacteroidota bacterium]
MVEDELIQILRGFLTKYAMISKKSNQLSSEERNTKAENLRDGVRFTIVFTVIYGIFVIYLLFRVRDISALSNELMTLTGLVFLVLISMRRLKLEGFTENWRIDKLLLNMDELSRIKSENQRLKKEIELSKERKHRKKQSLKSITVLIGKSIAGKPLSESINLFLEELSRSRKVSKETTSNLLGSIFNRITRIGLFTVFFALLPSLLLLIQTRLLNNQNELIINQNKRIEQQTYLQEAERRSSMLYMLDGIFRQITKELNDDYGGDNTRNLSPQSIAQIIAVSQRLKPYRFLENGELIRSKLSPERGQLLVFLIESGLEKDVYKRIFRKANFAYSDMRGLELKNFVFDGINLHGADFSQSHLYKISFKNSDLSTFMVNGKAYENIDFYLPIYQGISVEEFVENMFLAYNKSDYAIFDKTILEAVIFDNCEMIKVSFKEADLVGSEFLGSRLYFVNFEKSILY